MVKDNSSRVLSLSREIRDLSAELDRLLLLQASSSSSRSPSPVASTTHPSVSSTTPPSSYRHFRARDVVRITNRYGGDRGQLAHILDTSASQTFELKLLHFW